MPAGSWLYEKQKPNFVLPKQSRRVGRPWAFLVLANSMVIGGVLLTTGGFMVLRGFAMWEGILWQLIFSALADAYLMLALYGKDAFRRMKR